MLHARPSALHEARQPRRFVHRVRPRPSSPPRTRLFSSPFLRTPSPYRLLLAWRYAHEPFSATVRHPHVPSTNTDQCLQFRTKSEPWDPLGRPSCIVPRRAISTQQLPKNVLHRTAPVILSFTIAINGGFGVWKSWKSGLMSVSRIGRRCG